MNGALLDLPRKDPRTFAASASFATAVSDFDSLGVVFLLCKKPIPTVDMSLVSAASQTDGVG